MDDVERLDAALAQLDASLVSIRRFWHRPGVRRFLRENLPAGDQPDYRTLRAVESAESASIGDIACVLEVDASTASRLVDTLTRSGHVRRTVASDDRRRSVLELTPRGREALSSLADARLALLRELTAAWSLDAVTTLAELLRALDEESLPEAATEPVGESGPS